MLSCFFLAPMVFQVGLPHSSPTGTADTVKSIRRSPNGAGLPFDLGVPRQNWQTPKMRQLFMVCERCRGPSPLLFWETVALCCIAALVSIYVSTAEANGDSSWNTSFTLSGLHAPKARSLAEAQNGGKVGGHRYRSITTVDQF